ncbi:MAG TPA: hypothetical protein VIB82_01010 [Caulobacteraceae bacterium]|jgi:hypothetical protein
MSVLWPNRATVNPSWVQILVRIVHWGCAIASIYYLYRMFAYLLAAKGNPNWTEFTALAGAAVALWLGGRGLRFVVGRE